MMAYLHCHNCDFSQDDFWNENGYTPFRQDIVNWYKDLLFTDKPMTIGDGREKREVTPLEFVAHELERKATNIRSMVYRTEREFKEKNPDRVCPKCGKKELDID